VVREFDEVDAKEQRDLDRGVVVEVDGGAERDRVLKRHWARPVRVTHEDDVGVGHEIAGRRFEIVGDAVVKAKARSLETFHVGYRRRGEVCGTTALPRMRRTAGQPINLRARGCPNPTPSSQASRLLGCTSMDAGDVTIQVDDFCGTVGSPRRTAVARGAIGS
jgi:hypothetical protein